MSLIKLLLDSGLTPDAIPNGCNSIGVGPDGKWAIGYEGNSYKGTSWFLANIKIELDVNYDPITASDFVEAYYLLNKQATQIQPAQPEQHQTIEQLIAQMDTLADMAKRNTMEQIRLRDLISARLNPLGYCLTKK